MLKGRNDFYGEMAIAADQRNKERDYWLAKFSGDIKRVNFPYDYPRSSVKGRAAAVEKFAVTGKLFSRLMEVVGYADVMLHMVVSAIVVILLNKFTGGRDIIIGTPVLKQEVDGDYINTVLGLRNQLEGNMTFKELLFQVRQTIIEAAGNQNYPIKVLLNKLDMSVSEEDFPLFDVAVLVENIHDEKYIRDINLNAVFSFLRTDDCLHGTVEYNSLLYDNETIASIASFFTRILGIVLFNADIPLSQLDLLSAEEKNRLLVDFNNTEADYPRDKTIHELFDRQVKRTPGKTAVVFGNEFLTYQELEKRADRTANYLYGEKHVAPEEPVGLLMERSMEMIIAIMGIIKSGAAYVPLDPSSPEERLKNTIDNAAIGVVISQGRFIKILNRLQWECGTCHTFLCPDTEDIYTLDEEEKSGLMDRKLWEHVGESAVDEITAGGWFTSFKNESFSKEEMAEYGDNILLKLKPLLHKNMRILEIGCASGISMYRLAPLVGFYCGTDLSGVIIKKNEELVNKEGFNNIVLSRAAAHEIDNPGYRDFDIIIMNSVIHNFHGHNYLRKVIDKAVDLLGEKGYIFIGDVMDQDLKGDLIREVIQFKKANKGKGYRTKTDWSAELFVSRAFFEDLAYRVPVISEIEFSKKIYTIENELTKFRYDTLIKIDKKNKRVKKAEKVGKWQHDKRALAKYVYKKSFPAVGADNLAYVIYTSGSTGDPKGVMIEHRSAVNRLNWMQRFYPIGETDMILQKTPVVFDVSVWELFWWAISGASVCFLKPGDEKDPYALIDTIERNKITTMHFVPSMLHVFLKTLEAKAYVKRLTSLKQVFASGEALRVNHVTRFNELLYKKNGTKLVNLYGPTEAAVDVTYFNCSTGEDFARIPIGKPIDNIRLYIIDKNDQLTAVGIPGELCIGGVGVARGYLKEEQQTAEKFVDDPFLPGERMYRTGDLARWLRDGNIEFLGRIDYQVKIRGYRIELGEIESQLLKHEDIREAVAIAREDVEGEKYICAYVVLNTSNGKTDKTIEISEIKDYLSGELPAYMIPQYIVQFDKMPLTPGGKIDRNAFPMPRMEESEEYVAPGNDIEEKLQEIWSEVLGIEKKSISMNANFFELGGHSLKAVVLVSMIRKEFGIEFPFANVFGAPNIASFSEFIGKTEKKHYENIRLVEKKEYYPQSSAQKRLFFLDQFEDIGTSYNITTISFVGNDVDNECIEDLFGKLITRHESLRTSFEIIDDIPVQKIHDNVDFSVNYYEINREDHGLGKDGDKGEAADIEYELEKFKQKFTKPFDLSVSPLFRVGLVRAYEDKYFIIIDMHHIITDGISQNIVFAETRILFSGGELMPLRIQYKDFAQWQNSLKHQDSLKRQEAHWLNLLSGDIPVLNLPTDFSRSAKRHYEGAAVNFILNKIQTRKLKKLVKEMDVTLYMTILAVFNIMLAKISGQDDIIVGTPIAGRRHDDLKNVVGMFVNILVMRHYPSAHKSFKEFLLEVRGYTLEAYENQDYQFEDLVEKISAGRDSSRNPVFDVVFNMLNHLEYEGPSPKIDDAKSYIHKPGTSRFDLILTAVDFGEEISFFIQYCARLFSPATIDRFCDYFREIMSYVLDFPGGDLSEIKIISQEEQQEFFSITPIAR